MKHLRRSGAPSAFTSFLALVAGVTCAATAACSSDSASSQGSGWLAGGGPLNGSSGGANGATSSGTSSGGGTSSGAPSGTGSGGTASSGGAVTPGGDAGAAGDATAAAAADGSADGPREAAVEAGPPTFSFTLLDTTITGIVQGSPVSGYDPIAEGATINLAAVGSALSVRANTVPATVGSVAFALDATYTHTENATPYTLCGDDGAGTITSCAAILTVGKHTLTATPYSAASLGGDAGAPAVLDFEIVDVADAGAADAVGQ